MGEYMGIMIFAFAATLFVILLVVACCHRYQKIKQLRATAAMLPHWDGHQTLNGQIPVGPDYMPAPQGSFQPMPNVLYTGRPYHHPFPAHVQFYQQQHFQATNRLPNACDRQDYLGATPGAWQLNQEAALSTPSVVGCFYGAPNVPANPYGPTNHGFVEHPQQYIEEAVIHPPINLPPTYDQAIQSKTAMTAVSD